MKVLEKDQHIVYCTLYNPLPDNPVILEKEIYCVVSVV